MATRLILIIFFKEMIIRWPLNRNRRNSTRCNYLVATKSILIIFFKKMIIKWPLDCYQHHTSRKWWVSGQQIITNNILRRHDDLVTIMSLPTSLHKIMMIWWPLDHYRIINPRCNYLVTTRSWLTSLLHEVMIY